MGSSRAGSPWSQPPRTFAESNFRLARERKAAAQPKLPQGPWRPPSRQTRIRTPAVVALAAAEVPPPRRAAPRPPPSRPRTACAERVARHQSAQSQPAGMPGTSRRDAWWAAGLTTREAAEIRGVTTADLNESNRRLTPRANAVALRLNAQQKQERQTRHIAKILRQMIASRRSVTGKQMGGTIVSAFEALDRDGSGRVSSEEFSQAMLRLGMGLTSKQLGHLFCALDADGDGSVSLREFVSLIAETPEEQQAPASRPRRRRHLRKARQAEPAADAAVAAEALRCAATEFLLGHAAIDACRVCWEPSSALRAIDLADVGAGAALAAAVQ